MNGELLFETLNLLVALVALYFAAKIIPGIGFRIQKRSWLFLSIAVISFALAELSKVIEGILKLKILPLYAGIELIFVISLALGFYYLYQSERYELAKVKREAISDGLTGFYNQLQFKKILNYELQVAKSSHSDRCLLFLDIDDFKNYNDTYGHEAGNVVLKKVAESIMEEVRGPDVVSRYGGEEFAILLDTDPFNAVKVAERIRKRVEENCKAGFSTEGLHRPVTVSIGMASAMAEKYEPAAMLETADRRMYEAKRLGKNRVCRAG